MSGESLVEEFEDLFLLLLIRVSTNSAIKYWKIAWLRRTDCPRRYSAASRMTNLVIVCSCLCVSLFLLTATSFLFKYQPIYSVGPLPLKLRKQVTLFEVFVLQPLEI